MNTAEFYEQTGSNYQEARARMLDDARILRFVKMFAQDTAFVRLGEALLEGRTEDAFHAAHDLKGVCLTLSMTTLARHASDVTEALRAGDCEKARVLYPDLKAAYEGVIARIPKLEG